MSDGKDSADGAPSCIFHETMAASSKSSAFQGNAQAKLSQSSTSVMSSESTDRKGISEQRAASVHDNAKGKDKCNNVSKLLLDQESSTKLHRSKDGLPKSIFPQLKASELTLSSAELIAVMERVKHGNLSVDDAIAEVLAVDSKRNVHETDVSVEPAEGDCIFKASNPVPVSDSTSSSFVLTANSQHTIDSVPTRSRRKKEHRLPGILSPDTTRRSAKKQQNVVELSNEDQIELMNSVRDGQMSVEQALRLVESRTGFGTSGRTHEELPYSKHAPNLVLRPISQSDLDNLELKHALAEAGATVDISQTQLSANPISLTTSQVTVHSHHQNEPSSELNAQGMQQTPLSLSEDGCMQCSGPDDINVSKEEVEHVQFLESCTSETLPKSKLYNIDLQDGQTSLLESRRETQFQMRCDEHVSHEFSKENVNSEANLCEVTTKRDEQNGNHSRYQVEQELQETCFTNYESLTASTDIKQVESTHSAQTQGNDSNMSILEQLSQLLLLYKRSPDAILPEATVAANRLSSKEELSIGKRITLILGSNKLERKLVQLPSSVEELIQLASQSFDCSATSVHFVKGGEVTDVAIIRDEDELIVCTRECKYPLDYRLAPSSSLESFLGKYHLLPTTTHSAEDSDWIKLNVGGVVFQTTRGTITREKDSMLALMFTSEEWNSAVDEHGAYLIDRNPKYFEPLLGYLRNGVVILDQGLSARGVLAEAHFFGLWGAVEALEPLAEREVQQMIQNPPINRNDMISHLLSATTTASLRCQGLNFQRTDFSCLDLRHINFKMADMSHCNLSNCNLEHCNFENTNLQHSNLDGSSLLGCILSRAKLDFATVRNCNFHDPAQRYHAVLEGASCRSADFEDSNLSCVNMRVACFKRAKLRHCNLRNSNMAGTDLGESDLSGCNLHGANLRGANTMHATFNKQHSATVG